MRASSEFLNENIRCQFDQQLRNPTANQDDDILLSSFAQGLRRTGAQGYGGQAKRTETTKERQKRRNIFREDEHAR